MPNRDELLDLIVRWEEAKAQGQPVAPDDLCLDRPDLRDALQLELAKLGQVAWLEKPIESATSPTGPHPAEDPAPELPRMFAERYRLDALIGQGGFGRVFRGFDTWLERPVALKVPRIDRPVSGTEIDLCRLEARKAARLRHPHIVPVHDVGREGNTCFIVSEWIDGDNLAVRIAAGRPTYRESAMIVAQVADALHFAHRHGFVHRDVKPANILLDDQGQAFLTDFGIAVVEEELLGNVTAAGTLPYMAPEQLADGLGPVDHRSDVYALGVVLFETLTGRRPFQAASPVALREQILHDEPPRPRSIDPGVPEELERISLQALAKQPDHRHRGADALATALRLWLHSNS